MNNMMNKANEPAFPNEDLGHCHVDPPHKIRGGLTNREYFAALAMQGMLGQRDCITWDVSEDSVKAADALISALSQEAAEQSSVTAEKVNTINQEMFQALKALRDSVNEGVDDSEKRTTMRKALILANQAIEKSEAASG